MRNAIEIFHYENMTALYISYWNSHLKMLPESLKIFCDLVESGSFSKAASNNFVSQSAVS